MLLFSLTLSLRLEKRCCCQVVFILSLHDAFDYKQDLIFVETHCLRFSLPPPSSGGLLLRFSNNFVAVLILSPVMHACVDASAVA